MTENSFLLEEEKSFQIDQDFEFEAPKFADFSADAAQPYRTSCFISRNTAWFEVKHCELEPAVPHAYDPLWTETALPKPRPVLNLAKLSKGTSLGKILKSETGAILSPDGKLAKLGGPQRLQSPKPKPLLRTLLDPANRSPLSSPQPLGILSPRDNSPKRPFGPTRKLTKAISSPAFPDRSLPATNQRKSGSRVESKATTTTTTNPTKRPTSLKKPTVQMKTVESTVRTRIMNKPTQPNRTEPTSPKTAKPIVRSAVPRRKTEGPTEAAGREQRNRRSEGEVLHPLAPSRPTQKKVEKEDDEFRLLLEEHNKKVGVPEKSAPLVPTTAHAETTAAEDDRAFLDLLAQHNKKVQPAPSYEPRKYAAKVFIHS